MRRREAVLLHASACAVLLVLLLAAIRVDSESVRVLLIACTTASACGAVAMPLLRPLLLQANHDATAAALLVASTLAATAPVLAVVASPTVGDALTPPRLALTMGSILGLAAALPFLVRAWRTLAEFEWRHVALAALGYGVLLAPGQDVWFPLGVLATHVIAFATCVRVAWQRDAIILPAA